MALRTFILGCLLSVGGLGLLSASQTRAQGVRSSLHFERLEGVSHNTVLSILQARRGFL